ncbi:Uncharacterised protein [Mycobacteroides abscessus subsp. abscessus]|nr:Uncharacterised protein [Mycobacteroides abscessus subsp. abscessus]
MAATTRVHHPWPGPAAAMVARTAAGSWHPE